MGGLNENRYINEVKSLENAIIIFYKSAQSSEEKKNITLKEIFPMWVRFKQKHTNSTSYIKRITSDYNKFYLSEKDFINMPKFRGKNFLTRQGMPVLYTKIKIEFS